MDRRLIPLNGLLALLRGDGGWPATLRDQGLERSLLEAPVITSEGNIKVDAILYRIQPNLVLLCECKSGKNLERKQADRYAAADAAALARTGVVPPPLRGKQFDGIPMIVGMEEERAALEASLNHLGHTMPLLTIGDRRVRLSGASGVAGLDDVDVRHDGGLPPARIRVDHQSPAEEIRELVVQQIVAAQARSEEFVQTASLCDALVPEWPILSQSGQRDFVRRVESVLGSLAGSELRGDIRFDPATQGALSRVVILRSPATYDPRGATQGWQGLENRASRVLGRGRQPQIAGQMSIEDLADAGGLSHE